MSRKGQIIRQFGLISSLESRSGRTVAELAQELKCSERTIWRDLQDLKSAGFPLHSRKEEGRSHLGLGEGYRPELPLSLSCSELISLYLSHGLPQPLEGTPFQGPFDSLFARVKSSLSAPMLAFLQQLEKALPSCQIHQRDYPAHGTLVEKVSQAIMDQQTLEIQYQSVSREKVRTRKIDPYRLWYQEGRLYLIAYCHLRRKVLTFDLGRIRAVRPTSEIFLLPEGFRFEEYIRDNFGLLRGEPVRVKILFSAHQAPWIAERLWHPSQKMQYQLDGSLLMNLEVADTLELKRWILGLGKEAEVVEPKELREAIRQEAEGLLERYAGAGKGRRKGPPKPPPEAASPKGKLAIEIV